MPTPAKTGYRAVRGYVDHAARNSKVQFNILSADWTAWGADTSTGTVNAMFTSLDNLSLDTPTLGRASKDFDQPGLTSFPPTSEAAVNSAKLLTLFQDTVTGKKFSQQIPARNTAHYTSIRGFVDIGVGTATTQIADYIAAAEAVVVSEDGNPVIVYQMRVIGKGTAA